MKTGIKKKDIILIIIIIVVAGGTFFLNRSIQTTGSEKVIVKVNGAIKGTYDLQDDQEISINGGKNVFVINKGTVDMIEADCPDKLCVNHIAISKDNESIICLPNKVVVEIESASESTLDGMTN